MDYLPLILLWIAFFVVHSGMITPAVTGFMERRLGSTFRFYRLFYNAFALATFIPLMIYSQSKETQPFFAWEGPWRIIPAVMIVSCIALFAAGMRNYSMSSFIGLDQLKRGRRKNALSEYGELETSGILGVVRHPWYTAVFLLVWADDLDAPRLIVKVLLTAYLVVGTWLEERKMILEFGAKYRAYQREVSMFFPWKWLVKRVAA
jgi:methanethiol S-methyltransferase